MSSGRRFIFIAVNLLLLAVIFLWLRDHISFSKVSEYLSVLPLSGLMAALALNVAALGFYGSRLALLLDERQLPALGVVIIGFGLNAIFPFRLGEVAKLGYARQLFGIATSRLAATTTAEKILDLCALLTLGLTASQFVAAPYLKQGISTAALLVGVALAGIAVGFMVYSRIRAGGRFVHVWLAAVLDTLRNLGSKAKAFRLISLTAAIWALTVVSVYAMFHAVIPAFSPLHACVLTLVLSLAIAIPSTPAGLGIVEASIVAFLHETFNMELNHALASALVFHLLIVVPQVLLTAAILLRASSRRQRSSPT